MRVDYVGPLLADNSIKLDQRLYVQGPEPELADDLWHDNRLHAPRPSVVEHGALSGVFHARDQHLVEASWIQAGIQVDDVDGGSTDVQPCNDA